MSRTNIGWRRSRGHSEGKGEERMEHPLREGRKKGDAGNREAGRTDSCSISVWSLEFDNWKGFEGVSELAEQN